MTWTRRRVSELIDGLAAGVSVRSTTAVSGGLAVLKTSAIDAGLFDPRESKTILPADIPRARCPVAADSMIISRMNTPAMVGDVGYVAEAHNKLYLPDRLWLARSKRGSGTDMRWLTYYFASEPGARELRSLATGTSGSMKNIPKDRVLELEIAVPPEHEQRAIARALVDVDELIAKLESFVAKKQAIKQGMMQQLLTGRTRLPGFADSWSEIRLGDHVDYVKTVALSRAQLDAKSPLKYLHYGDIHTRSSVLLDAASEDMPRANAKLAARAGLLQRGDVVFADASEDPAGVGKSVEITDAPATGVVPGLHTIAARFDKSVLADGFKAYLQFIPSFRDQLLRLAAGTKVLATTRSYISSITLTVPDVAEQRAIAEVLLDADREIETLRVRLSKAREIKSGMMQQLLTGRTRLSAEAAS